MNPTVVISGSFRKYLAEIGRAAFNFRRSGIQVLTPLTPDTINSEEEFVRLITDDPKKSAVVLEKEFMSHISEADFLYVANVEGYIGKSVAAEMSFAIIHNIPIIADQEIGKWSEEISAEVKIILKRSVYKYLPIKNIDQHTIEALSLTNAFRGGISTKEKSACYSLIEHLLEELKHVKL